MNRKVSRLLCILILLCAVFDFCCGFWSTGDDFAVSLPARLDVFAVLPLLWLCIGALITISLGFSRKLPKALRCIFLILALLAVAGYAVSAAIHLAGVRPVALASWCVLHEEVFLLPGLLASLSLRY